MRKKIVVFSGAGVSRESGILTFRDSVDGLWNNCKIDDVATPGGWRKDREKVLDFYNGRRRQLPNVQPNQAHIALAELEKYHDVTIVTQNVDDLHERAGSTNILHLHGELTKARTCYPYPQKQTGFEGRIYDIGYNDINVGDKCEEHEAQLRPHIVWFGEMPENVQEAYGAIQEADVLVILGTSLSITYTIDLLINAGRYCRVIYIDPDPSRQLDWHDMTIEYVLKPATEGVTELVNELKLEV
jgi:NAD-dependent deacetylase